MYLSTPNQGVPSCGIDPLHAQGVSMGDTQSQVPESGFSKDECHVRHGSASLDTIRLVVI